MSIGRETEIGDGGFGRAMRTELPYINDRGEIEHASFCVTKEFFGDAKSEAERNAMHSANTYKKVKQAGLKLKTESDACENVELSLYKLSPDGKKIVMNDLEMHGWTVLNKQSDGRLVYDDKKRIDLNIDDFNNLLKKFEIEALKAARERIQLSKDCWLILRNEDKNVTDFIIGDFDRISCDKEISRNYLEYENLIAVRDTLSYLVQFYLSKKERNTYTKIINRRISSEITKRAFQG